MFTLLADPTLPWIISIGIILIALILWFNFKRHIETVIEALNRAISAIEEADGQTNFKKRFPTIFKKLSDNPLIGDTWRAYAATIETAPNDTSLLGYSRRPRENFNENIVIQAGLNLRFYQAVPNLLVGAGLLFTFLGLVGALHFASAGVAASDVVGAQSALGALLGTATFKFMTSIAGLASSILFNWREKVLLSSLDRAMSRFCTTLEARMVPITPESLLAATLKELRMQSAELDRLAGRSVALMPTEFEREVRQTMRQSLDGLKPVVEATGRKLADLDRIIDQEIEESLSYRREIESIPAIADELTQLRSEVENLTSMPAEHAAPLSEAPSQTRQSATRERAAEPAQKTQGWFGRLSGKRRSDPQAQDDTVSRKLKP